VELAMSTGGNYWSKIRIHFLVSNTIVALAALVLFGALVTVSSDSQRDTVSLTGSVVMAAITFLMAFGFLLYGVKVACQLTGTVHTGPNSNHRLARHLLTIALFFSVSFVGEAVMWIFSATTPNFSGRASNIIVGIYLGFDCICILTVLYAYLGHVKKYEEEHRKSRQPQQPFGPRQTITTNSTKRSSDGSIAHTGSMANKGEQAQLPVFVDIKAGGAGGQSLGHPRRSSVLDSVASDTVGTSSVALHVDTADQKFE